MFTVYVLYSERSDRLYIGQSGNLRERLQAHESGKVFSTKPFRPWKLVYQEQCSSRAEAMKRERELKSHQGREFIRREVLGSP